MIYALAERMASSATLALTMGTNLFVEERPLDAPDNCTVLLARTGADVDDYLNAHRQGRLQVLTRNVYRGAARTEAERIVEWLLAVRGYSVTDNGVTYTISSITGGLPGYIGPDAERRHEFSANLVVRFRKET